MVDRHMDRLKESKEATEQQYEDAKLLHLEKSGYGAIGIVGMVTYQLYAESETKDEALLQTVIEQLNERIERAQKIGDIVLEAIGCFRSSLCYLEKENFEKAVQVSRRNFELTSRQHDATKIGFARASSFRPLRLAGYQEGALSHFNLKTGCPPIIALCKEISGEYRQSIAEMIQAGANLKLRDDQVYSALECTIYNVDEDTSRMTELGLRAQIEREGGNVESQYALFRNETTLPKGYRDIFQDQLRPVLLGGKHKILQQGLTLQELRQTFASALASDAEKHDTFDRLKYDRYADFVGTGRLPRSSDGYTYIPVK